MRRKLKLYAMLATLAALGVTARADPPAMVGRIALVQGQVTLAGEEVGLNWPVSGASHLSTASGARTELRIGSTAVRLDGDSDLEISELDDDLLRLRLHYGSVSIRVRSPDLLRDFELSTPQARITLLEPGVLRVDVERVADTSQISMLAGSARVDGAGSSVTLSAGRHLDVSSVDLNTTVARRDGFDLWSDERERATEALLTSRYVPSSMTGYEELERHGSWSESVDYGPVWTPRNIASDWAPYRDGRWIWLAPWGWTWVDSAPWGYAPSHYGRWVMLNRRWCWVPERAPGRPVWAPALVGWVGGAPIGREQRPGLGWFPLAPRERYVPHYPVSPDTARRLYGQHDGPPVAVSQRKGYRDGLTVLPREQFEGRQHSVPVVRGSLLTPALTPALAAAVVPVTPPRPSGWGQPGRVLIAPLAPQPVATPMRPGRPLTTLAPGQFGQPDAPSQTIDPSALRIELRPSGRPRGPTSAQTPGQPPAALVQQAQPPLTITLQPPLNAAPQPLPASRERHLHDDERRAHRAQDERRPPQTTQQPIRQPTQQPTQQPIQQPTQQLIRPAQPLMTPVAPPGPAPASPAQREPRDSGQDKQRTEHGRERGERNLNRQ